MILFSPQYLGFGICPDGNRYTVFGCTVGANFCEIAFHMDGTTVMDGRILECERGEITCLVSHSTSPKLISMLIDCGISCENIITQE